jgi:hypothetical protein
VRHISKTPRAASVLAVVLVGSLLVATACFGSGGTPSTKPPRRAASPIGPAGIGAMRLGDTFRPAASYRGYDYLVVGYSYVGAAAKKIPKALVYKGAVDVTSSPNSNPALGVSGVSYREAAAHGLVLKDAAGHELKAAADDWIGDVGSRDFQERWVRNVERLLLRDHGDGVFIDNVVCSVTGLSHGVPPAKYPTDAAWADAQASFIAYVGQALRRKGLYVAANAYCGGPDDGSGNNAWLSRIAPNLNGEMIENFEQNPNNRSQLYFDSPSTSWLGNWLGKLNAVRAAQRAKRDAFVLTYGSPTDLRTMTYARASFLLVWNGRGGGFFYTSTDGADPTNRAWTTPVGRPLAPIHKVDGAYFRPYSHGYVVVNPSLETKNVPLPPGLRTLDGAAAPRSIELASTTAAIFTR